MVHTKLKPVLPSLREKKRYLAFEVISREKIRDFRLVSDAVLSCSLKFLGQLGAAKAGIMVLNNKWDQQRQRGIIKVSHKHVDYLRASLALENKIGNDEVIIRSLGVSGALNKLERKFLNAYEDNSRV